MALQKTTAFNGITIANAYFRIYRFEGDKTTLTIYLETCASSSEPRFASSVYEMPFDMTSTNNPIKQAYEHLKTLSDFAGAVDVLEAGQTA
ncbi:hypothetical protein [Paraburkholderia sediminicola]|uniref:hypothetical protein n=1 Tax=Paraburkholderia sediminicola TaxID=458836 RepID=UPI0038B709BB